MDTWQQYTLRANTEFQLACYGNAILMHNQALDHARHQFSRRERGCVRHALDKVIISNFNLADCYLALDEYKRAADCYLAAQNFLLQAQQALPEAETDSEHCLHVRSQLHTLWCELIGRHGDAIPYDCQLSYYRGSCELVGKLEAAAVRH